MATTKRGISEKVPHAYTQYGVRFYALWRNCQTTDSHGEKVKAVNFYVFDRDGLCWLQILHTVPKFINQIGCGIFEDRSDRVLEVDDPQWDMIPNVPSDEWIDGSCGQRLCP